MDRRQRPVRKLAMLSFLPEESLMSKIFKPAAMLALVASFLMVAPSQAPARTRDIVKYGAIGLGAAYLYNLGQRSAYRPVAYYPPYYGGYYTYVPAPVVYRPVVPVVPVYRGCW
jgi:hypothetical protein